MPLKIDKFTWAVVGVVVLLLVGAVLTSVLTGQHEGVSENEYVDEDTPEAAVRNAYVAFRNTDPTAARRYYSSSVLADMEKNGTFNQFHNYSDSNAEQRLRILGVEMRGADEAAVTIAIDRYSGGGLFNSGSTWTERQTVPLIREEGAWKINTLLFFY